MTLTHKKLDLYSFACLLLVVFAYAYIILSSHNGIESNKLPVGYDFYAFWSAGKVAIAQGFVAPFDSKILQQFQTSSLPLEPNYINPWFYPPLLLYWLSLLWAQMPYLYAYVLFCVMMIALYYYTFKQFHGEFSLNTLLAFPAFTMTIVSGQNGALSAFCIVMGLLNYEKRPFLAGFFFGLLAYKPQLCLLLPFAILAGGHWRVISAGVVTLLLTSLLSLILFGLEPWLEFFKNIFLARDLVQGQGKVGFEKIASLYSALRFWGIKEGLAYLIHFTFALIIIFKTCQIWRSGTYNTKAMSLILGTLLVTPHVLDYDYVMTAFVFILFLRERNMQVTPFEFIILLTLWIMPLIGLERSIMEQTGVPLLILSNFVLFLLISSFQSLKNTRLTA